MLLVRTSKEGDEGENSQITSVRHCLSFINYSWSRVSLVESRLSSIQTHFKYLGLNDVTVETKNPPPSNLRWLELGLWAFHRNRFKKCRFFKSE